MSFLKGSCIHNTTPEQPSSDQITPDAVSSSSAEKPLDHVIPEEQKPPADALVSSPAPKSPACAPSLETEPCEKKSGENGLFRIAYCTCNCQLNV